MSTIRKINEKTILNNQGYVQLYDFSMSNLSLENRVDTITKVASTSFGKTEALSPRPLYNKLLAERNTTLEFIRVSPTYDIATSFRNDIEAKFDTDCVEHSNNVACVKIRVPLMVTAHIFRHRSFSYNQCSRRYTTVTEDDIFLPDEFINNEHVQKAIKSSITLYNALIKDDIKKEIARGVLPAYLIMSDMWMIGDKKAWKCLFNTRLSKHEKVMDYTKELVQAMYNLIKEYQPKITE